MWVRIAYLKFCKIIISWFQFSLKGTWHSSFFSLIKAHLEMLGLEKRPVLRVTSTCRRGGPLPATRSRRERPRSYHPDPTHHHLPTPVKRNGAFEAGGPATDSSVRYPPGGHPHARGASSFITRHGTEASASDSTTTTTAEHEEGEGLGRAAAGVGDRGESRRVADPSREVPRRRGEMRRPHAWCDGSTSPAAFLLAAAAICGQFATGACCVSSLSLSRL